MLQSRVFGRSHWFYVLSVMADEASTFTILALGGVELNPFVASLIKVHPLLWSGFDLLIFLALTRYVRLLKKELSRVYVVLLAAGAVRLLPSLWNVGQLILFTLPRVGP